jgi:hypothetical protein
MTNYMNLKLKNTVWYVPTDGLNAYFYNTVNYETPTIVKNQTIWIIDESKDRYFYGKAYVFINEKLAKKTIMAGLIDELNNVIITFNDQSNTTTGYGTFKNNIFYMNTNQKYSGKYSFMHYSKMLKMNKKCDCKIEGTNITLEEILNI